jgi:hypothetical protein
MEEKMKHGVLEEKANGSMLMKSQHAVTQGGERTGSGQREGRWLVMARVGWLVVAVLTLAIFGACLPGYLGLLQVPCTPVVCEYQQLTAEQIATLAAQGLTLGGYAVLTLFIALVAMAVCLGISALIMWRRSDDHVAFLIALLLITLGPINIIAGVPPGSSLLLPAELLLFLSQSLQVLGFLLFPSGQFVPRWMRWVFFGSLVAFIPASFFPAATLIPNMSASQPGWLVALAELVMGACVQVYRYQRISSPMQRQQTKWVVFGIAIPITILVILNALALFFPAPLVTSWLYLLVFNELGFLLPILLPLALSFAMLRYRLWEIDTLINRTLVYGLLTVLLATIYGSLVLVLQVLLRGVIQQSNPIVLVGSTLVMVVLFRPLHQHIQTLINRLFYRQKYDAASTLTAFSAFLRTEVNADHLCEQIVGVVQQTMHPTFVSLWLVSSQTQAEGPIPQPSPPHELDHLSFVLLPSRENEAVSAQTGGEDPP